MTTAESSYDYFASICDANAALRAENTQLRKERDEASAERDQLALRLTKATAELKFFKTCHEDLAKTLNGLGVQFSSMVDRSNLSVTKRSQNLIDELHEPPAKRVHVDDEDGEEEEKRFRALTGALVEEDVEEDFESDEDADPVLKWVQSQDQIGLDSRVDVHKAELHKLRSMFHTTWSENSRQEIKFMALLEWVFPKHYNLEGMLKTFDQYACWSFGKVTDSSGPCPWARHANKKFSCETDHRLHCRVSRCHRCDTDMTYNTRLCIWLCHADVDTGYPARDSSGIIRKRGNDRKVADKHDWRRPERLTENIDGKQVRWIVHLYQ